MNRAQSDALRRDGFGQLAIACIATKAMPHALRTRSKGKPVMDEVQVITIARFLGKREFGVMAADAATIIMIMTDVLLERKARLDTTPEDIEVTLAAYVKKHRLMEEAYTDTMRAFAFVRSERFPEEEVAASKLWMR